MNNSTLRQTIETVVSRVLRDAGRDVPDFDDDLLLADQLKLDSLDLAVTVVTLEQELGVDPFRDSAPPVRTFGDFVALYEKAQSA